MLNWITRYDFVACYANDTAYSGVYVMYAFLDRMQTKKKIVYIGKSDHLRRRMSSHSLKSLLKSNGIQADYKIKLCVAPEILEASLIRKLNPMFNFQYSDKPKQELYIKMAIEDLKGKISCNNFVFYKMLLG